MRLWIILMIMVLSATTVFADKGLIETYKPNEIFSLSVHLTNITGEVLGADCNVQIKNESFDTIQDADMNEIGGGWYNYTYNQTKVGSYFCRQNCTQGSFYIANTCDFIIGVEENMSLGMLVFIPLFIAMFLLVVSWMLEAEKYWALKLGMILLGFVFIFQAYHFNNLVVSEFFTSSNITNAIGDATWIYGMTFIMILSIFLITFIYDIFMMFSGKKHKTGDYGN